MANENSHAFRLHIQFNTKDEAQRQCLNFLGLCGNRKNKILGLMAKEFIETYGFKLDEMTEDDVKVFLDSYQYIQNFKRKNAVTPIVSVSAEQAEEVETPRPANKKKNTVKTKTPQDEEFEIDENMADQALSAFGL